ncbi:MAG: SDR family oxidoreductase [Halobacteriovoraceae bacterium]|jgi:nucleoside-diphosphate-sugar epimerase|nr:SDR family oxidoreductase [Halobacteriovoraceae bacterium]MBT5093410.1 SDR family oxidoreductase [Halobacteriovoraceae bacterium]
MKFKKVTVTGGAGYVGAVLIPALLDTGVEVVVLDLLLYGRDVFPSEVITNPKFSLIQGDIRNPCILDQALQGCDAIIHLACISNDPSFDLDPELGKSINLDAFEPLVKKCIEKKINRFIYASSSSVYGVKTEKKVTEELTKNPLTDYSKYKLDCEEILLSYKSEKFTPVIVRPATVCGYSPRQRLDVIVNILTNLAFHKREISVFGGEQLRPNIHIKDMVRIYLLLLELSTEKISGKIFNAGYQNYTVNELSELVKEVIGSDVSIKKVETDDLRSYHISSEKIRRELEFVPKYTVEDAIRELQDAFGRGLLPESLVNKKYFNIKTMKESKLGPSI